MKEKYGRVLEKVELKGSNVYVFDVYFYNADKGIKIENVKTVENPYEPYIWRIIRLSILSVGAYFLHKERGDRKRRREVYGKED